MTRPLRAVITDDEPSGRDSVRVLLAREPDVDTVAECATALETVQAVTEHRPDLLFLDVQLPGPGGLEALERIAPQDMPVVVVVTAHDEYALRAFDVHAADYLLKPYSDARFRIALARARQRLEQDALERLRRGLLALARRAGGETVAGAGPARRAGGYVERLAVPTSTGLRILRMDEIAWIEAARDHACVHTAAGAWIVRLTMGGLERRLDPARFARIHRSTIVNVDFVTDLEGSPSRDYAVVLRNGVRRPVSGRGREQLARLLELRI